MEIVQERLFREFNMNVITTVPNVSYKVYTRQGKQIEVHNPAGLPDFKEIDYIDEPFIDAQIILKTSFFGQVMKLCLSKRGIFKSQNFLTADRVELSFDIFYALF